MIVTDCAVVVSISAPLAVTVMLVAGGFDPAVSHVTSTLSPRLTGTPGKDIAGPAEGEGINHGTRKMTQQDILVYLVLQCNRYSNPKALDLSHRSWP